MIIIIIRSNKFYKSELLQKWKQLGEMIMTEEEIKELTDIILQQGKYKKNKNKEPDYIYYEDLVPQMSKTTKIVYIIAIIIQIIIFVLMCIYNKSELVFFLGFIGSISIIMILCLIGVLSVILD